MRLTPHIRRRQEAPPRLYACAFYYPGIAFIINVFHIISTKQEMNHIADQLVKQIQLNGGTSGDTDTLFSFLSSQISDVDGLTYQDALRAGFINGMEERIRLSSEDYTVENISLQFNQYSTKIEYEVTCDATFRIQMFGELFPPITQHITLIGPHNTKY